MSACPQKSVAYAQIGVASPMDSVANIAALSLLPRRNAIKNRQAQAKAVGNATANMFARYEVATKPRGDVGSMPVARSKGLAIAAAGNASSATPGALSE